MCIFNAGLQLGPASIGSTGKNLLVQSCFLKLSYFVLLLQIIPRNQPMSMTVAVTFVHSLISYQETTGLTVYNKYSFYTRTVCSTVPKCSELKTGQLFWVCHHILG